MGTIESRATLRDAQGRERLQASLLPEHSPNALSLRLRLSGRAYCFEDLLADTLVPVLPSLRSLQSGLHGAVDVHLAGAFDGAMITIRFEGDARGHFDVRVSILDDEMQLTDHWVTDQTCLAQFLAEVDQPVH